MAAPAPMACTSKLLRIAVQQTLSPHGGEDTGCQGAPESAETVHGDNIEGIVITKLTLHEHAKITDNSSNRTDHHRPDGGNETGGGSNGDQTGQGA